MFSWYRDNPGVEVIVQRLDQPWEKAAGYFAVLKDREIYRMYYRGGRMDRPGLDAGLDNTAEVTCYAESRDGVHWIKPTLGHEYYGSRENNVMLLPDAPRRISHNFAPYCDNRLGVPVAERYKAVGGVYDDNSGNYGIASGLGPKGGLYRLVSADGVRWKLFSTEPIFAGYALDTLNALTWIESEHCYAIYLRTWSEGGTPERPKYGGVRTISRSVSKDFITWSTPEPMSFCHAPLENLYVNGTHPYFRAPHILIGLPFRFFPERQVLSLEEMEQMGVPRSQRQGVSDVVLISSRGGSVYERAVMESLIRPGLDRGGWFARNNAPALGVVPTGVDEMSVYVLTHYTLPDSHLRRYSFRLDGLTSIRAPYAGGRLLTKAIVFSGRKLVLNYSTSAGGSVKVELWDQAGKPVPGYSAAACDEIVGDEIARTVSWQGNTSVQALAGKIVRLRFELKDADLFSLRFAP